jgi:hypothetical protein
MSNANQLRHSLILGCVVASVLGLIATVTQAQTPPPDPMPAPPTDPTPAVPPPAEAAPATVAPVVAPPQPTIPETVPVLEEVPPPPAVLNEDADKSPLTINAWLRLGHRLQSFEDPSKLDKLTQDGEVNILMNAEIIDSVGLTANFVGTYGATLLDADEGTLGGNITGDVNILDLIARLDLDDAFHIWFGRMLVPSDRSNFSGPWFMSPWNYPGFFLPFSAPLGPHQGPNGRNDGVTIWGELGGGTFKYFAGAFELYNAGTNPLFSGRLSLSLINPEPGFYGNSTYYGGKDVFAIGAGMQAQKDGSGTDDFTEWNADLLFEKNFAGAGALDIEGAFYKYEGDGEPIDYSWFALISFLIEANIGPGQIQPLFRVQGAKPTMEDADSWTIIDAQLGYIVSSFACRFALGYQHQDVLGESGGGLFFGIQLQK